MQKQITLFKSVIDGMESYFHFDSNCPIPVAKAALLECLKWVGQIEDAAKSAAEAQNKELEQNSKEGEDVEPAV